MAYPTVDKPYGLQPINLIGGQVYAGSTRLMRIVSGYATSIYYGDVVKIAADGTIQKDVGTSTATPVGVFLGCTYTNPTTSQKTFSQYWPTGTVASDAQGYVVDDPDILFKVATVSAGTTVAFYGSDIIGANAVLVQNAGSNSSGDSAVGIFGANVATTASFPIRIVDIVPDTSNGANGFCEYVCKFNAPYAVTTVTVNLAGANTAVTTMTGGHQYLNPTGI
jgi:hypothetical protein